MHDLINYNVLPKLKAEFHARAHYGYTSIGQLFNKNRLMPISNEIDECIELIPAEKNIYASNRKYRLSSISEMPSKTKSLIEYLNSDDFINVLQDITGIDELQSDPELRGGGIHAIGRGGYLKFHTDFNWHSNLQMHRRLNLLIYLNDGWSMEWECRIMG